MFQLENDIPNLTTGMQISRDLRRSMLCLDGPEVERHRTRRSLMSIYLLERELGDDGGEVARWLFTRSRGSRLVMADIFDEIPIPSSNMADEYAVEYINNNILTFRWLYEYIMYGDPDVERGYTQEEYDMCNRWAREHENGILAGMMGDNTPIRRKGIVSGSP